MGNKGSDFPLEKADALVTGTAPKPYSLSPAHVKPNTAIPASGSGNAAHCGIFLRPTGDTMLQGQANSHF